MPKDEFTLSELLHHLFTHLCYASSVKINLMGFYRGRWGGGAQTASDETHFIMIPKVADMWEWGTK